MRTGFLRFNAWYGRLLLALTAGAGFDPAYRVVSAAAPRSDAPLDLGGWIDAYVAGSRALEAGDLAVARERLLAALEFAPQNPQTLHQLAALAARSGRDADALELLRRAIVAGFDDAALLEWDPDLEALRARPEFDALVAAARGPVRDAEPVWSLPSFFGASKLAVSRDGRFAAFGRRTVVIVEFEATGTERVLRGRVHSAFELPPSWVTRLAFDDQGTVLGVAYDPDPPYEPKGFVTFDLATRRLSHPATGAVEPFEGFADPPGADARKEDERDAEKDSLDETIGGLLGLAGLVSNNASARLPDSDAVAVLDWSGRVSILRPSDRRIVAEFVPSLVDPGFAVRDDSGTVLLGGAAGRLVEVDLRTGRELRVLQSPRRQDFESFALADGVSTLRARDASGTMRIDPQSGEFASLPGNEFEPSVVVRDQRVIEVDLEPSAGFEATRRVEDGESAYCAGVRDGRLWVGTDRSHVYVFDLATESAPVVIDLADLDWIDTVEVGEVVFSPDGKLVIFTSSGLAVAAAYDTATLTRRWQVIYDSGNGAPMQARFSHDGKTVAFYGQGEWTPRVVDAETGVTRLDLAFRGVYFLEPTDDPALVLADTQRGVEATEVPSARVRWSRLALRDGSQVERSVAGFVFGTASALAQIHVLHSAGSDTLAALAPALLDLKKIRAATAGIPITPPRIPPR